ncbi:Hypothetical predicted protein, partial [Prunus dulcis]
MAISLRHLMVGRRWPLSVFDMNPQIVNWQASAFLEKFQPGACSTQLKEFGIDNAGYLNGVDERRQSGLSNHDQA